MLYTFYLINLETKYFSYPYFINEKNKGTEGFSRLPQVTVRKWRARIWTSGSDLTTASSVLCTSLETQGNRGAPSMLPALNGGNGRSSGSHILSRPWLIEGTQYMVACRSTVSLTWFSIFPILSLKGSPGNPVSRSQFLWSC
jgi:hypothetical protein